MKSIVSVIAAASVLAALAIAESPRYTVIGLGPVGGPPGQPYFITNKLPIMAW